MDEDGVSPVGLNLFAIRFAFVRVFCSQSSDWVDVCFGGLFSEKR